MTQMVVAEFDAASAADAAVRDLEAAQFPSAVIRRYVNHDPDERIRLPGRTVGSTGATLSSPWQLT
jgi:hypothetical protein